MSVRTIKTSVMKMQHVEIQMAIILAIAMMDSWVMVSLVQVFERFLYKLKMYKNHLLILKYLLIYLFITKFT